MYRPLSLTDRRPRRRRGFTLIELLVVMGIIGLLLSLTLPAVQQAREAARRTLCINHIRQLALACQNHHSMHGAYPEATSGYSADIDKWQNISIHARLLPFLEQSPLYNRIDMAEQGRGSHGSPPTSELNAELLNQSVEVFVCPSDRVPVGGNSYRASFGVGPAWHGRPENGPGGAFRLWVQTRDRDFSDGLSNTLFFSERLVGDYATNTDPLVEFTPARDPFLTDAQIETVAEAEAACSAPPTLTPPHDSYGGATWLYSGWRFTCYNHIRTPNSALLDCENGIDSNGAVTARSYHTGGVNVALGDGSARFIGSSIDLELWRALASRANHEPVSEY